MSTKFEAAARALFLASGRARDVAWEDANKVLAVWPPGDVQDVFRRQVVAVLEAIRDPDEAMIEAGHRIDPQSCAVTWREMVGALLAEARGGK